MKNKLRVILFSSTVVFSVFAMWEPKSGQIEKTRYKVNFESVATISCDNPDNKVLWKYLKSHNSAHVLGALALKDGEYNCNSYYKCTGKCVKTPSHPLIGAGETPYVYGNGGLLNPKLVAYSVTADKDSSFFEHGACVTLKGIIETDGIAPYGLNAHEYGNSYNDDPQVKVIHKMTHLEEAILGALKERSVDRGLSDSPDSSFKGGKFLRAYCKCVKKEWTSHLNDADDGKRTSEHTDIIMRYFPRNVYWASEFKGGKRMGRIESELLSGWSEDESSFRISLDTFTIDVEAIK